MSADYPAPSMMLLVTVSAAFAAGAIAAGTYAWWLSRREAAEEALTNVHEILKTCQDRMSQMEDDLNMLPARMAAR